MAKDDNHLAEMTADDGHGWLSNEETWSAGTLWKLGSWAAAAVGSLIIAFFASHAVDGARHDQIAAAELVRQAQQIQWVAKEGQTETRRLSSAVDTLNGDRDRLYARVTVLEQGLESVTGSVARHTPPASLVLTAASQPVNLLPPAVVPASAQPHLPPAAAAERAPATPPDSAPETTAAQPGPHEQLAATTISAPPDPGAPRLVEARPETKSEARLETKSEAKPAPPATKPVDAVEIKPDRPAPAAAAAQPLPPPEGTPPPAAVSVATTTAPEEVAVSRTEFGVDLGAASSVDGLRALWRGLLKSDAALLTPLRPLVAIRERSNGFGMQLRLVAGPLNDAAAAARICAALGESRRPCETTVFDGQRLTLKADAPKGEANPGERAGDHRAAPRSTARGTRPRHTSRREEPAPAAPAEPQAPAQPEQQTSQFSGLTSIFHR